MLKKMHKSFAIFVALLSIASASNAQFIEVVNLTWDPAPTNPGDTANYDGITVSPWVNGSEQDCNELFGCIFPLPMSNFNNGYAEINVPAATFGYQWGFEGALTVASNRTIMATQIQFDYDVLGHNGDSILALTLGNRIIEVPLPSTGESGGVSAFDGWESTAAVMSTGTVTIDLLSGNYMVSASRIPFSNPTGQPIVSEVSGVLETVGMIELSNLTSLDILTRRNSSATTTINSTYFDANADATGSNGDGYYRIDNFIIRTFSSTVPPLEVYPHMLLDLTELPSLQERVGNRHWAQPAQAAETSYVTAEPVYVFCKDPAQNFRCQVTPEQAQVYAQPNSAHTDVASGAVIQGQGLWLRTDGTLGRYQPVDATVGASYRSRMAGVQIGYDHVLLERENGGRLIGGLNLNYRMASADVITVQSSGKISTTGYGVGGSLTWYEPNGFYLDAQAQAMWLESDLSANGLGRFADGHKAMGYGVSVEIGKEIALNDTWAITPQAQLSYANVKESGYTDAYGTLVSFNAESLQLRLGVEVSNETSWEAEDGTTSRRSLRAGAHVIHEFKPETQVVVSGTPLRSKRDATSVEITLGGTYNWRDDRNSIYGQVAASTGLSNFGDSHRIRGTVGYRRQWE